MGGWQLTAACWHRAGLFTPMAGTLLLLHKYTDSGMSAEPKYRRPINNNNSGSTHHPEDPVLAVDVYSSSMMANTIKRS